MHIFSLTLSKVKSFFPHLVNILTVIMTTFNQVIYISLKFQSVLPDLCYTSDIIPNKNYPDLNIYKYFGKQFSLT